MVSQENFLAFPCVIMLRSIPIENYRARTFLMPTSSRSFLAVTSQRTAVTTYYTWKSYIL